VENLGKVRTPKWRTIRVKQELVEAVRRTLKSGRHRSISKFASEAIRLRLDELKPSQEKIAEKQAEYPVIHERLLFTSNHMWATVTPGGNIRVGLSDYAQRHLKGIASIQTHPVGYEVKKEEPFGVVETSMFMFDLYSPVSGKIIKINKLLQNEPFIINKDPYKAVWIAEIKPNNLITLEEELRDLMKPHQYTIWVSKLGRSQIPQRSEQIWWTLVKLFEDLIRKGVNIDVEIAPKLRNCRTLINFLLANHSCNTSPTIFEKTLRDLQYILEDAKHDLISLALKVSEDYAKDWINKLDEAERGELKEVPEYYKPNFVPGIPPNARSGEKGWLRLALPQPISNETVDKVIKRFGVSADFESDSRIILTGEKKSIKRAARALHRSQSKQSRSNFKEVLQT